MARRQIVSRTVVGVEVNVLALDCTTAEVVNKDIVLSGSYMDKDTNTYDEKKILKALKKSYETDDFKIAKIVSTKPANKLYGMWEEDFIANAMELDPTTRKPIGMDDADIDVDAE